MTRQLDFLLKSAGIRSMEALGRKLAERSSGEELNARSFAIQLGRLNKGLTDWWLKRPKAVDALVEILGCTREDLLLHESNSTSTVFEFEDFPELRPLDLAREEYIWLGRFFSCPSKDDRFETDKIPLEIAAWLGWSAPGGKFRDPLPGVTWLNFPPGTGADLFWAYLKARTQHEAREATSVSDVAERLKQYPPLCVRLSDSCGRHDAAIFSHRHPAIPVLVVASFDVGGGEIVPSDGYRFSWQQQNPTSALSDAQASAPLSEWNDQKFTRFEWRFESDWKTMLLQWVERRLCTHGDSLFDAKQMTEWLTGFGTRGLVESPREMLSLCRLAHHAGARKLPRPTDRNAGRELLNALSAEDAGAKDAFAGLVQEWLSDLTCGWICPISASKWRELSTIRKDLLDQLVEEGNHEERKRLASALKLNGAVEARVALNESSFLRRNHAAEVCLAQTPIAKTLARDTLCAQILRDEVREWGVLCFDASRFELIQQSLAMLTISELEDRARFLNSISPSDAGVIGAEEAIFCALGFRDSISSDVLEELSTLAQRVIDRATSAQYASVEPWSIDWSARLYWENACWARSLTWHQSDDSALGQLVVSQVPHCQDWRNQQSASLEGPQDWLAVPLVELGRTELRCIELARRIVHRVRVTPCSVSGIFVPIVAARCAMMGWELNPKGWDEIFDPAKPLMREILAAEIACTADSAEPILRALLRVKVADGEPFGIFSQFLLAYRETYQLLRETIFTRIDSPAFVATLTSSEIVRISMHGHSLPPAFVSAILKRLAGDQIRFRLWDRFESNVSPLPFDVMLQWIDDGFDTPCYVRYLWQVWPKKMLEHLSKSTDGTLKSRLAADFMGDASTLTGLLRIMMLDNSIMPAQSERAEWALSHFVIHNSARSVRRPK